jgi:GNAT superfamily N-acetyltransferase
MKAWTMFFKVGIGFFSQARLNSIIDGFGNAIEGWAELTDVYVHPIMRHRGLAKARITEALMYCDRHKLSVLLCVYSHGSTGLQTASLRCLYKSFGFKPCKTRHGYMVRKYKDE